jgi:hypothetical protein
MVPLFSAPDPVALTEALTAGAQPAFLGSDPSAPLAWLLRSGRVRESVGQLTLGLVCGHTPDAGPRLQVAQLPPAERWVALPLDAADPPAAATSLVVHSLAPLDTGQQVAGVVVDSWVDVIPRRELTTGLTFNFDAPGARAPQAILLAVPAAQQEHWSLDGLVAVVQETADLARIRMVGPEETPWFGRLLPALHLADNLSGDTLHVDLSNLVRSMTT